MSEENNKPILCSACEARAEIAIQTDGGKTVVCTGCDARADYERVKRDLLQQAKEHIQDRLLRGFSKPGSKWKVTKSVRPKRVYPFYVELE